MKAKRTIIAFFTLCLILGFYGAVLATNGDDCVPTPPGVNCDPDPPQAGDGDITIGPPGGHSIGGGTATGALEGLITRVVNFIFWAGLIICPLIVVIGGFMYMTAGGNFSRATSAKKLILWAIIGLAIAAAGKFIIGILKYILNY